MRYRSNSLFSYDNTLEAICVCCSPPISRKSSGKKHQKHLVSGDEETLEQMESRLPFFGELVDACIIGKIKTFTGKRVDGPGRLVREIMLYKGFSPNHTRLVSVQTKKTRFGASSLGMVKKACEQLIEYANAEGLSKIYVPAFGTGSGCLRRTLVIPLMNDLLDDRFVLVVKPFLRRISSNTSPTLVAIIDGLRPEYEEAL